MKIKNYALILLPVFTFTLMLMGCDQKKEARAKIASANQIIDQAQKEFEAATKKEDELDAKLEKAVSDNTLEDPTLKDQAQSLAKAYEQTAQKVKAAAEDFKKASAMKIPKTGKEYYALGAEALSKRVALIELRHNRIKLLIDMVLTKKDVAGFGSKMDALNKQREMLNEEAEKLEKQGETFYNANRALFED